MIHTVLVELVMALIELPTHVALFVIRHANRAFFALDELFHRRQSSSLLHVLLGSQMVLHGAQMPFQQGQILHGRFICEQRSRIENGMVFRVRASKDIDDP
jgi:hypothetical protein